MKRKPKENNFTGCLLGGAIGDALGAPIEFMSLDTVGADLHTKCLSDSCSSSDELWDKYTRY